MCAAADFLRQIREKEKELQLKPDPAIDAYLKATALSGKRQNAVTNFIMRVLGLEVRSLLCSIRKKILLTCPVSPFLSMLAIQMFL